MAPTGPDSLTEALVAGDRRALARAITLAESTRAEHRERAGRILAAIAGRATGSLRIGISGAPGVGKSTFIEALGSHVVGLGHRLAVLAVDPSSPRSGGSILGDKTRMERLARAAGAFVRPSPSGGTLGGVARRTRETVLLCEAAGFDVVMVETVGAGQSEAAVANLVDAFVLVLAPGGGDELQGIKRGIVELADIVVVNKADGDLAAAAGRAARDYGAALALLRPRSACWQPPVLLASALEGNGIPEVWNAVEEYRSVIEQDGGLAARRSEQARAWLWDAIEDGFRERLRRDTRSRKLIAEVEARVATGEQALSEAAAEMLARVLKD